MTTRRKRHYDKRRCQRPTSMTLSSPRFSSPTSQSSISVSSEASSPLCRHTSFKKQASLHFSSRQVVDVALYRSPALSATAFDHVINDYIRPAIAGSTQPTVVVGDFNVDARQSTVLMLIVLQHLLSARNFSSARTE